MRKTLPMTSSTAALNRADAPIRALVIEDDPTDQDLIRAACAALGWSVTVIPDPGQAIDLARAIQPRAVILDAMLVAGVAAALAAQVREVIAEPQVRIIAWSYAPGILDVLRGRWWDAWILKPTDPPQRASRATRRFAAETAGIAAPAAVMPAWSDHGGVINRCNVSASAETARCGGCRQNVDKKLTC